MKDYKNFDKDAETVFQTAQKVFGNDRVFRTLAQAQAAMAAERQLELIESRKRQARIAKIAAKTRRAELFAEFAKCLANTGNEALAVRHARWAMKLQRAVRKSAWDSRFYPELEVQR